MISTRTPARVADNRRRKAFDRGVAVLRQFRDKARPEEMERVAGRLEEAIQPAGSAADRTELLTALKGGRSYSDKERLEIEASNIARFFQWRRDLLEDSLSAIDVARLLGTSRQTPHDRVKAGTLLAVRDRGGLRFPGWQFDPNRPDGVVSGFPEVLKALNVSPPAKASWFLRANPYLEGRTPLEALKAGELARLVPVAHAVEVS